MKKVMLSIVVIVLISIFSGCSTTSQNSSDASSFGAMAQAESPEQVRMLIWSASLYVEVSNVSNTLSQVISITKKVDGYVESESASYDDSVRVTLRIPVNSFKSTVSTLETLGNVTHRRVSSDDVTEEYIDIDARLKTMIALRDRLRVLLERAEDVKDVLAVERELSRIQADIDSMQARLKALAGKVDFATINININRKRILGPLGLVFHGLWWGVEKLFVLQK